MTKEFRLTVMCGVDEVSEGDSGGIENSVSLLLDEVDMPDINKLFELSKEHDVTVIKTVKANGNEDWQLTIQPDEYFLLKKEFRLKHSWPVTYRSVWISKADLNVAVEYSRNNPEKAVILAQGFSESEPHLVVSHNNNQQVIDDGVSEALDWDFDNSIVGWLASLADTTQVSISQITEGNLTEVEPS